MKLRIDQISFKNNGVKIVFYILFFFVMGMGMGKKKNVIVIGMGMGNKFLKSNSNGNGNGWDKCAIIHHCFKLGID
jgi:hypothetical protein